MALTRGSASIVWGGTASKTLNSSARVDSDAYTFDATDVQASISIHADNQGTPASGDVVNCYLKWASDGSNYDTDEHAEFLFTLDTYGSDTPGEDPAQRTVTISTAGKSFKLSTDAPNAGTRNVVLTAQVGYQRSA